MGIVDGGRHQDGGFVAGVAEHQALVTGALVEVVVLGVVDALGDVGTLLVIGDLYRAAPVVDAIVGVVVADALDRVAGDSNVVNVGLRGDLAGEQYEAGSAQGLCRNAGLGILGQQGIEDGIRNLVSDLVRVAFGNRFGGKEVFVHLQGIPEKKDWALGPETTVDGACHRPSGVASFQGSRDALAEHSIGL